MTIEEVGAVILNILRKSISKLICSIMLDDMTSKQKQKEKIKLKALCNKKWSARTLKWSYK